MKTSRFWRSVFGLVIGALLAGVGCSDARNQDITGETHFLRACDPSAAADCGTGLACVCGVCTRECGVSADCSEYPSADCIGSSASPDPLACGSATRVARCDVSCGSDADCGTLSGSHRCELGFCRAGSGAGGGGSGGAGGADSCVRGQIAGNQVVVLGDTFMALTHQVTAGIEELAREAGSLAVGQRYRDESTSLNNALALNGNGISAQYGRAVAEASVSAVIMNGGGADVLGAVCDDPPDSSCAALTAAAAGAAALFEQMASDGVAHVVYAFYPNPVDTAVRARMDALRPLIEASCERSPVPCQFVDLRSVFEGHYGEYVIPDGLNPTAAGAQAAAGAIWATMQEHCVAQ